MKQYLISILLVLTFGASSRAQLPVNIIPAVKSSSLPMVFFISGDGGWNSFDKSVSDALAKKGIPVTGLDAQKYFWNAKRPDVFIPEISKAIVSSLAKCNKTSFTLVGYSFGASVSTFLASGFTADLKTKLQGLILLSPDEKADFEIHIMDMLSIGSSKDKYDVLAQLKNIKALQPVCIFGNQEDQAMKTHFKAAGANVYTLPGNHHYNNDYQAVADAIASNIPKN